MTREKISKQKFMELIHYQDKKELSLSILSGLVVGMITTMTQFVYYYYDKNTLGQYIFAISTIIIIIIMYAIWYFEYAPSRKVLDEGNR